MAVTPVAADATVVVTGGTPVVAIAGNPAGIGGGILMNPASASDQGLLSSEDMFVDPVGSAGTVGNGTTFRIGPGQIWKAIPGQTTPTSVNAALSGHHFSGVKW